MTFADHKASLIASCEADETVTSLLFFGSSTEARSRQRDAWSDLDFNVFFTPEANARQREEWAFLPDPGRIVLRAREGADGGVVIYDDGTLFEFGAGQPWPIRDPACETAIDGDDLLFADPPPRPDAANAVRLFLAKLYIGVGRHRRGERVAASAHVRTHAVKQLCWALRARLCPDAPSSPFDPTRRFEDALPELAGTIEDLLDGDLERCARGLLDVARTHLEPGWPEFPGRAADTVARRLGWDARCEDV